MISDALHNFLYENIISAWNSQAWHWDKNKNYPDMGMRLDDKLAYNHTGRSYYNALIDEEYFTIASAGLLYYFYSTSSYFKNNERLQELSKIIEYIPKIIDTFFVYEDGWWKLQPGVWMDHPDYQYAVYNSIEERGDPISVPNIMEDTSHFSRVPRMLHDFKLVVSADYATKIDQISESISLHFITAILEKPKSDRRIYLTRNYMSGENGLYRWNYSGRGTNYAYGPYSLSAKFYGGTWIFLRTLAIREIYQDCPRLFPIELGEIYSTRALYSSDVFYSVELMKKPPLSLSNLYALRNGFFELCCILISYIE
jgi:hypothetical protein